MKQIPLMRPLVPALHELRPYFARCARENTYSNFGSNYWEAVNLLYKVTGRYMTLVTTGTAAISLACRTILSPKSRVMVPDFTHLGTIEGLRESHMVPILCAVDDKKWTIDLIHLAMNVKDFDAFVVVAPFGYYVDIAPYEEFAKRNNKKIIYDYAGAWGQFPDTDFPVIYSLHATKLFSTGEGGLVSFKYKGQSETARILSNFGITPMGDIYQNGSNLKMDEIRAGMLCAHLRNPTRLKKRLMKRRSVLAKYCSAFHWKHEPMDTPSMCVFSEMGNVDPSKILEFKCKFYYPLLSEMRHLEDVEVFSKSIDYMNYCLALPIDVNDKEQAKVIEVIDWHTK